MTTEAAYKAWETRRKNGWVHPSTAEKKPAKKATAKKKTSKKTSKKKTTKK